MLNILILIYARMELMNAIKGNVKLRKVSSDNTWEENKKIIINLLILMKF